MKRRGLEVAMGMGMGWRMVALAGVLLLAGGSAEAQRNGVGTSAPIDAGPIDIHNSTARRGDAISPGMQQRLEEQRNAERQKKLLEDTNKLLELATQLKAQVEKTDKNTMSLEVIRQAEEIEKLAKNVKQRMKG